MSFKILKIKIDIISETDEKFGREISFKKDGLTIFRAENTMGKSTIANSILYALGLDAMLSTKHEVPLTYAIRTKFMDGEKEVKVKSSSIYLEIENDHKKIVTLRRDVSGVGINHKIIKIMENYNFNSNQYDSASDYFIRDAGSASREKGFHYWLEKFLGWDLPYVNTYDGKEVKLYLECIFPLFFIEQKAGWHKLQATVPTNFKIKDPRQKAIEYILNFERLEQVERLNSLEHELQLTEAKWNSQMQQIKDLSRNNGVQVLGLTNLSDNSKDVLKLQLLIKTNEKMVSVHEALSLAQAELKIIKNEDNLTLEKDNGPERIELFKKTQSTFISTTEKIGLLENRLSSLRSESTSFENSIEKNNQDLNQFKDLLKLRNMGSDIDEINFSKCPTCNQDLSGNILHPEKQTKFKTFEENISFLEDEKRVLTLMKNKYLKEQEATKEVLVQLQSELLNLRSDLDLQKQSLTISPINILKVKAIKAANLEIRVNSIQNFMSSFEDLYNSLISIKENYHEILLNKKKIPKELTSQDKAKLLELESSLKSYLTVFQFKSIEDLSEMNISETTYHPQVNNIDWYFDLSSSDNIRGIWAYTLAMSKVIMNESANLPGFLVFDEPKQQSARLENFLDFIGELTALRGVQSIIFTSEPSNVIAQLKNKNIEIISLTSGERVIGKL